MKGVLPEYVSFASQSPFGRAYFLSMANQTVNLASVNITHLRAFPIPLAPENEQQRILDSIKSLFGQLDVVEEASGVALLNADQFGKTILDTAFKGELVPQDREDEPASALLERIRLERTGTQREPTSVVRESKF